MRFMTALERKWLDVESHENKRRHLGTPTSVGSACNRGVLPDKSGVPISHRQQFWGDGNHEPPHSSLASQFS
jgi:hypothetical protein